MKGFCKTKALNDTYLDLCEESYKAEQEYEAAKKASDGHSLEASVTYWKQRWDDLEQAKADFLKENGTPNERGGYILYDYGNDAFANNSIDEVVRKEQEEFVATYEQDQENAFYGEDSWANVMKMAEVEGHDEVIDDLLALDESVKYAKDEASAFEKEATQAIADAEKAGKELDEIAETAKEIEEKAALGNKDLTLTDEQRQVCDEITKEMGDASTAKDAMADIQLQTAKMVTQKPISYTFNYMKNAIDQLKAERAAAKDTIIAAEGVYHGALANAAIAVGQQVSSVFTPAKDAVVGGMEKFAEEAGKVFKKALGEASRIFGDIANSAKAIHKILQFRRDVMMCKLTLGLDSHLWTRPQAGKFNNPAQQRHNAVRGLTTQTEIDSYWKSVEAAAYKNGTPLNIVVNGIQQGTAYVKAKLEEVRADIAQGFADFEAEVRQADYVGKAKAEVVVHKIKADVLGMKAAVADELAKVYEKSGKRCESKIKSLEEFGKTLFESQQSIQEAIEKLTSPVAHERAEYKPDPALAGLAEALRKIESPSIGAQMLLRSTEKSLEKEKAQFEKREDREESLARAKDFMRESELAELQLALSDAKTKIEVNEMKLESAREKLERIGEQYNQHVDKSRDLTAQAIEHGKEAANLENDLSEMERDDD